LRVLQDFQVRPVGSTQSVAVNVRIVSATNKDLEALVEKGEFREDLFYRLNVVPLRLPPLRERREDIPLLIEHFLGVLAQRSARARKRFAPDALDYLIAARWPGNIRQLQNVVEQCVVLCTADLIPINLAQSALRDQPGEILPLDEARLGFDRRYLISVLRATAGNVTAAARMAGRNRTEFYKLLAKHGLEPAAFRKDAG
jgi:two-component system response regulator GlrR